VIEAELLGLAEATEALDDQTFEREHWILLLLFPVLKLLLELVELVGKGIHEIAHAFGHFVGCSLRTARGKRFAQVDQQFRATLFGSLCADQFRLDSR
jgi:hypothetical protein